MEKHLFKNYIILNIVVTNIKIGNIVEEQRLRHSKRSETIIPFNYRNSIRQLNEQNHARLLLVFLL